MRSGQRKNTGRTASRRPRFVGDSLFGTTTTKGPASLTGRLSAVCDKNGRLTVNGVGQKDGRTFSGFYQLVLENAPTCRIKSSRNQEEGQEAERGWTWSAEKERSRIAAAFRAILAHDLRCKRTAVVVFFALSFVATSSLPSSIYGLNPFLTSD